MNETQENIVSKRHQLSPEDKYQIFIEATMAKAKGNGSIAEVLRRFSRRNDILKALQNSGLVGD
jgi:hypothetical protein